MYKVGFYYPTNTGHSVRGIGFYANGLLQELLKNLDSEILVKHIQDLGHQTIAELDLIHIPFFDLFLPTFPNLNRPIVVTIHDVIPLSFPNIYRPGIKGKVNFQIQKYNLKSARAVITDSMDSVTHIHKYLNVPHEKLKLIYLAASSVYKPVPHIQKVQSTKKKYQLPHSYVLFVGDINYNKNLPTLLRACIALNQSVVLVGKSAAQIETLSTNHAELAHLSQLKELIKSPLIHRTGFVPDSDLVHIYNGALAYCQPSFQEGFGLPVLEAMQCGVPVIISSSSASLREIAGDAGMYFDANSADDLMGKIQQLKNSPSLRKSLSQSVRDHSLQFSWSTTGEQTLQTYKQVLYAR